MLKNLRHVIDFNININNSIFLELIFEFGTSSCFCIGLTLDATFGFVVASASTESTSGKGFLFDVTLKCIIFSKFTLFTHYAFMHSFCLS